MFCPDRGARSRGDEQIAVPGFAEFLEPLQNGHSEQAGRGLSRANFRGQKCFVGEDEKNDVFNEDGPQPHFRDGADPALDPFARPGLDLEGRAMDRKAQLVGRGPAKNGQVGAGIIFEQHGHVPDADGEMPVHHPDRCVAMHFHAQRRNAGKRRPKGGLVFAVGFFFAVEDRSVTVQDLPADFGGFPVIALAIKRVGQKKPRILAPRLRKTGCGIQAIEDLVDRAAVKFNLDRRVVVERGQSVAELEIPAFLVKI